MLFAIADSYCNSNNIDLTREPNAGSGALDFKFSQGLAKVTCEVKYSSNNNLVEGYEKQLSAYNIAEKVNFQNSVYLVIRVNDKNDAKIALIQSYENDRKKLGKETPTVIVINGIKQPSASKRK